MWLMFRKSGPEREKDNAKRLIPGHFSYFVSSPSSFLTVSHLSQEYLTVLIPSSASFILLLRFTNEFIICCITFFISNKSA